MASGSLHGYKDPVMRSLRYDQSPSQRRAALVKLCHPTIALTPEAVLAQLDLFWFRKHRCSGISARKASDSP